jgi:hypothetical protein
VRTGKVDKILQLALVPAGLFAVGMIGLACYSPDTEAANLANFKAGNIMSDSVMTNKNSLTASQIQSFLNSKVSCDTNGTRPASEYGRSDITHAQYAALRGWHKPPYTCLNNYNEGGRSAAQIIYDAGQQYGVNPQSLIVLLQKEQGLVTDTWPLSSQYRGATGYGCPDTAPCDSEYYGFVNQVNWAAKHFGYVVRGTWGSGYNVGNNNVRYNPNAACGSSNVYIENRTTQALYLYTPYQPNQAALAAGYGQGDSCSAHGNRNFYAYFTDWFGATRATTPWKYDQAVVHLFTDSGRTKRVTNDIAVEPGQKLYGKITVMNAGYNSWEKDKLKLGTSGPTDRSSVFYDSSWLSNRRLAQLQEESVKSEQTGTLLFVLNAPKQLGTYSEKFNLVSEGQAWFSNPDIVFNITVTTRSQPTVTDQQAALVSKGYTLNQGDHILSPDKHSVLILQDDGNLVLYTNGVATWCSAWQGAKMSGRQLVMQDDGNLVLYDKNRTVIWHSNTSGNANAYLKIQADGNLVVYSSTDAALWHTSTGKHPDFTLNLFDNIKPGATIHQKQSLVTADGVYHLTLQDDGNLVVYSYKTGQRVATWASAWQGAGMRGFKLIMQSDGNLVLYDKGGKALWASAWQGAGMRGFKLIMQSDGNLVLYPTSGAAIWHSNTYNR